MLRKVELTVVLITLLLVTSAADLAYQPGGEGRIPPAMSMKAQAPVDWPSIDFESLNLTGLDSPVYLTHAGDGSGRMFIVERSGRIRLSR